MTYIGLVGFDSMSTAASGSSLYQLILSQTANFVEKLRECRDYRDKMIRDSIYAADDLALEPVDLDDEIGDGVAVRGQVRGQEFPSSHLNGCLPASQLPTAQGEADSVVSPWCAALFVNHCQLIRYVKFVDKFSPCCSYRF